MAQLFVSFHPQEALPGPGDLVFVTSHLTERRYSIRVERVGEQRKLPNGRVLLTVWGGETWCLTRNKTNKGGRMCTQNEAELTPFHMVSILTALARYEEQLRLAGILGIAKEVNALRAQLAPFEKQTVRLTPLGEAGCQSNEEGCRSVAPVLPASG
ncbi:MAG TPA: hypothetical protein VFV38_07920 [Ktedonobacteraceae bacterium]|nr:hypothetical protein [Ktedonobacteraceae bacterium]